MKLCQIILSHTAAHPIKQFCAVFYQNNKYWLVDTAKLP